MSNTIGQKIKQLRIKFDLSQKQATALIGTGISHSSWAYWEAHGAPVERLAEIAKMTKDSKATYGWLTGTTGGQIPDMELVKSVPKGAGYNERKGGRKKKKKKKKTAGGHDRRVFTPQERANILADMDSELSEGGTINGYCKARRLSSSMVGRWRHMDLPAASSEPSIPPPSSTTAPREIDEGGRRVFSPQDRANVLADWYRQQAAGETLWSYCKRIGLGHSVLKRWMGMELPEADGAAVPGLIDAAPQSASEFTNLPQEPIPQGTPGPKPGTPSKRGGYRPPKVTKAKALITSQYLCPHCASPVFLPEE